MTPSISRWSTPTAIYLTEVRTHPLPHVRGLHHLHASYVAIGAVVDVACFESGNLPALLDQPQACLPGCLDVQHGSLPASRPGTLTTARNLPRRWFARLPTTAGLRKPLRRQQSRDARSRHRRRPDLRSPRAPLRVTVPGGSLAISSPTTLRALLEPVPEPSLSPNRASSAMSTAFPCPPSTDGRYRSVPARSQAYLLPPKAVPGTSIERLDGQWAVRSTSTTPSCTDTLYGVQ